MSSNSSTGVVKFFNKEKGFGFVICDDDNKDYFFHCSQIIGAKSLNKDDKVSFEFEENKKGTAAVNVTLL